MQEFHSDLRNVGSYNKLYHRLVTVIWAFLLAATSPHIATADIPVLTTSCPPGQLGKIFKSGEFAKPAYTLEQARGAAQKVCTNPEIIPLGSTKITTEFFDRYTDFFDYRCVSCRPILAGVPTYQAFPYNIDLVPSFASWALPQWSEWISRDRPSGKGDFETVKDLTQAGKMPCDRPTSIQCRVRLSGQDHSEAGNRYTCDLERGGICVNSQQAGNQRCKDYEVRFLCPNPGLAGLQAANFLCPGNNPLSPDGKPIPEFVCSPDHVLVSTPRPNVCYCKYSPPSSGI